MTDRIIALDEPLAPPASAAAARSCRWIDLSEGDAKRNAASPTRLTSSKGLLDPPPRFAPAFARLRRGKQRSGYRMEGRPLCAEPKPWRRMVSSDSQKGRDGARPSITRAGARSVLLLRAERDCFGQ